MVTVLLIGWRYGLRKIALTRLQQNLLHLSLKEAKENTDKLLTADMDVLHLSGLVRLEVPAEVAADFIVQANQLGAVAREGQLLVESSVASSQAA